MDRDDGVPGGAGELDPERERGGGSTGPDAESGRGAEPVHAEDAGGGEAVDSRMGPGAEPNGLGTPSSGTAGRGPQVRILTLLLAAVLVVVAAFGGTLGRQRVVRPVAQTLPPVVQPTGQLAAAFRGAREASLRIEARCGPRYGDEPIGIGTGFFIRSDGLVLTAYHVVDPTEQGAPCPVHYVGVSPERLEYPLTMVGFDAYHDLAVMQAKVGRAVPTIPLASDLPRPGTKVVAVGNSRQQFLQARAGEVTRLGVHAGRPDFADNTIELTTSLAPGDSGGPVVDAAGRAVGVVSYISFDPSAMTSSHYVPPFLRGVPLPHGYASYAVPVGGGDLVARLEAGERRDVPVVGFTWRPGFDYDPATSDHYLGPRPGVVVWQVQPGGPADRAGLRSYTEDRSVKRDGSVSSVPRADVITALDGTPTPTFYDLLALVRQKHIGETVTLTVQRGNATLKVPLRLAAERSVFSQR
ncbi:MAG: S1C family serine protease [Deinococcales bacterium]